MEGRVARRAGQTGEHGGQEEYMEQPPLLGDTFASRPICKESKGFGWGPVMGRVDTSTPRMLSPFMRWLGEGLDGSSVVCWLKS